MAGCWAISKQVKESFVFLEVASSTTWIIRKVSQDPISITQQALMKQAPQEDTNALLNWPEVATPCPTLDGRGFHCLLA